MCLVNDFKTRENFRKMIRKYIRMNQELQSQMDCSFKTGRPVSSE